MFTIKEWSDGEQVRALCERLHADAHEGDRVFVLVEGEPKAVGVLGLRHGKVILRGVYGDIDETYRDLMNRALLNVCYDFSPITVRIDAIDDYWLRFGFREVDGGMEVRSDKIIFCNH